MHNFHPHSNSHALTACVCGKGWVHIVIYLLSNGNIRLEFCLCLSAYKYTHILRYIFYTYVIMIHCFKLSPKLEMALVG